MNTVKLHTQADDTDDRQKNFTYIYVKPLLTHDTMDFINNVNTSIAVLEHNDLCLPISINNKEYNNSYVCSPYNACITYAKEELSRLSSKPLIFSLKAIINFCSFLLKSAKINQIVSVNNYLLSTNLYPQWDGTNIADITQFLQKRFPQHAIIFRSLNGSTNDQLISLFKKNQYSMVPSRQVYIFDKTKINYLKKHNTKIDMQLLAQTGYTIVTHNHINQEDYPRIVYLYNQLYIKKYSQHNPMFSVKLIQHWHQNKLLTFAGLRDNQGVLVGIIGCFERNAVTSAPLVGYETNLPQHKGLYRMLMSLVMQHANNNNFILNLSSGAAHFKRLRGAYPEIEYSAVYTNHLSPWRRFIWWLLKMLLTKLGVPLLKKYQL